MWKKIWQKWTSLKWTGFKTSFKHSFCLFVSGRTKLENTVKIKLFPHVIAQVQEPRPLRRRGPSYHSKLERKVGSSKKLVSLEEQLRGG